MTTLYVSICGLADAWRGLFILLHALAYHRDDMNGSYLLFLLLHGLGGTGFCCLPMPLSILNAFLPCLPLPHLHFCLFTVTYPTPHMPSFLPTHACFIYFSLDLQTSLLQTCIYTYLFILYAYETMTMTGRQTDGMDRQVVACRWLVGWEDRQKTGVASRQQQHAQSRAGSRA